MKTLARILSIATIFPLITLAANAQQNTATNIPIVFSGGHETVPEDRGRPVILIAGALKVPPAVFREAFSHVRPAPAGHEPEQGRVHDNKRELLAALGKYGITNERLDQVSDHYRYAGNRGEMWPTRPAKGYAIVRSGRARGFVITDGGSGYSSPPKITVPGATSVGVVAELSFGPDFEKNGSVTRIQYPGTNE